MTLIGWQLLVGWHVQWFEVRGGSMAPTLRGVHRSLSCSKCKILFACDAENLTTRGKLAICPNCGHADRPLDDAAIVRGDRLLMHKGAFDFRPPRRWELVALRSPQSASQVAVKRVVGLPGETISLAGGDVFANGVVQRKTLAELRELAIAVHDDRFHAKDSPDRWRGEAGQSRWRRLGDRYVCPPQAGSSVPAVPDWLTYHHTRPQPGAPDDSSEAPTLDGPIVDGYGYNQTASLRDQFVVKDLLLCGQIRATQNGGALLYASNGGDEFLIRLDAQGGRTELFHNAQLVVETDGGDSFVDSPVRLEFALADRQALLALNGRTVLRYAFERRAGAGGAGSLRLAPAGPPNDAAAGGLELWDLQLSRDVYYRPSADGQLGGKGGQYKLAADEYYVLGDNSPFSQDSRAVSWRAGVRAKSFVGKPFLVYYPSTMLSWKGWSFQVPELSRIRYIP